jgi:hypothetical protein
MSLEVWNAASTNVGLEGVTDRKASQDTAKRRKKHTSTRRNPGAVILDWIVAGNNIIMWKIRVKNNKRSKGLSRR